MSGLHGAEMVEMGRRLWGEPSETHSTRKDVRFGAHGSKSIDRDKGTWFDHEAGEGGAYADLYEKVHGKRPEADNGIVAEYDYHDATGRLLFQVVRKVPKTFRQRKPDGNGGWIWKLEGVERVRTASRNCCGPRLAPPSISPKERRTRTHCASGC